MAESILIVAATGYEIDHIKNYFENAGNRSEIVITTLCTGVGGINTAWSMMDYLANNPAPSIILNVGIAGSFTRDIKMGEVVIVSDDCFGDLGIEDGDNFMTVFEVGLSGKNDFPFRDGKLYPDKYLFEELSKDFRTVSGVTVNKVTGNELSLAQLKKKFNADIESMESAAVYYVSARNNIPAAGIRSISNYVEQRDREKWEVNLAINNLADAVMHIINKLYP